jgi:hypothetical protein
MASTKKAAEPVEPRKASRTKGEQVFEILDRCTRREFRGVAETLLEKDYDMALDLSRAIENRSATLQEPTPIEMFTDACAEDEEEGPEE